jgi:transcriptional regulator with XRE-family HTH domain
VSPVAYRDVARAFGSVLKTMRAGAGISQEKLAELADIDRTYPSLLERGLREPGLGVVIRLGNALKADPVLLVRMTLLRLNRNQTV